VAIDTTRLLQAASRAISSGEQEVEDPTGIDISRLLAAVESVSGKRGTSTTLKKRTGAARAFSAGLGSGLTEPFRLLGLKADEVEIEGASEQVANFLGAMVGLGISFVPFAFGIGIILKGLGLTAKVAGGAITVQEAARSQALVNFVRNTAAGATQFAGAAEEIGDVPRNLAAGAVFGGAIEGVFLARAMRGRAGAVSKAKLLDDGNPVPDVPVDLDRMVQEIEISPSVNKITERMTEELNGIFPENKPYTEVITDLLGEHTETVRLTGLSLEGSGKITSYAKENFPSAQVLVRSTKAKGVHEVLIHQPFDPQDAMTSGQVAQWKATGFAKGEEVRYKGEVFEVAPGQAVEGQIQIRVPYSKAQVFAVPIEEVTKPTTTRFFKESLARSRGLRAAIESMDDRVGFVVAGRTAGQTARRGFVDVSEFETAKSFDDFGKQFVDELANVQAASPEEAVGIIAAERGIPGLRIVDDGVTTRVHVFDQGKVGFVGEPAVVAKNISETRPIRTTPEPSDLGLPPASIRSAVEADARRRGVAAPVGPSAPTEVPNLGLVIDDAVMTQAGEIQSFTPSWKNSISAPLREAGFPEKEIAQYLDLYAANTSKRLDSLLDPEFQAIKNASVIQFGGCP